MKRGIYKTMPSTYSSNPVLDQSQPHDNVTFSKRCNSCMRSDLLQKNGRCPSDALVVYARANIKDSRGVCKSMVTKNPGVADNRGTGK